MSAEHTIVWWQNSLSIHQAPMIRALGQDQHVQNIVVALGGVSDERKKLGWSTPDYGNAIVYITKDPQELARLASEHRRCDVHVFSGIHAYREFEPISRMLRAEPDTNVAAMSESWDFRGIKGLARKVMLTRRAARDHLNPTRILACGSPARDQLVSAGYRTDLISPYGYFVDSGPRATTCCEQPPTILYVGQFIECKGVDILLRALQQLTSHQWHCDLIGSGHLESGLRQLADELDLEDRVTFHPPLSNTDTRGRISTSSVLVLPSRYDGWGVVVNEALSSGIPCVVTSAAGAHDLVAHNLQGRVVPPNDRTALATAIMGVLQEERTQNHIDQLASWSETHIAPAVVSAYLTSLFFADGLSPVAPWSR